MAVNLPMAADAEPLFPHIAIVGYGLIGASLGMAVRARWPKTMIIAIDRKDVVETAMRTHAADLGGDDLGLAGGAELVVLAAPARANLDILAALPDYVSGDALVTDVGSTKRQIVEAARALPSRLAFVGGHPLAGAAVSGIDSAREDLFAGRPWILTSPSPSRPHALESLLTGLGATPLWMDAAEHDRLVALISHLPQFTASALMQVIGERAGAEGLALAGRGLRDTTRLATSPGHVWRDIAMTNADNIAAALDALIDLLTMLRAGLDRGESVEDLFDSARQWKQVLETPER